MARTSENRLRRVMDEKKKLVDGAKGGGTGVWRAEASDIALGFGIETDSLRGNLVTISVPERSEVGKVVMGPDVGVHLDAVAEMVESDVERRQEVLEKGCQFLLQTCGRASDSSVPRRISGRRRLDFKLLERIVPGVGRLESLLEEGKKTQLMTGADQAYLHGVAQDVWSQLDRHRQEFLKSRGMAPENAFETAG